MRTMHIHSLIFEGISEIFGRYGARSEGQSLSRPSPGQSLGHGGLFGTSKRSTKVKHCVHLAARHCFLWLLTGGNSAEHINVTIYGHQPQPHTISIMAAPDVLTPSRTDFLSDVIAISSHSVDTVGYCQGPSTGTQEDRVDEANAFELYGHKPEIIFTSALEGAWTGIGHREMVWCHQVRWREQIQM
ncbi:hypothetical protein BDR05DRAFT_259598 [Suillus weaverae]|nr:hypothetical protein BDR05DRAFT_259598 [Suillus weaverae]